MNENLNPENNNLSNEDLDAILAYTAQEKKAPVVANTAVASGNTQGNTGGTNVSPFKVMPIKSEHQLIIKNAKSNV